MSIDTRHAEVARACVEAGASVINDVSGFRDPAMVEVARSCDAGLVVMHMKGEPRTMQDDPVYDDVVVEVRDYLAKRATELEAAGIAHDRICLDPGPGFSKTASQTMELMQAPIRKVMPLVALVFTLFVEATTTTTMAMVLYSVFMKVVAPSRMILAMSAMSAVPSFIFLMRK